ncbi:MAG: hypothetical protein AB7O77_05780 [Phycisphaerales bacterium]
MNWSRRDLGPVTAPDTNKMIAVTHLGAGGSLTYVTGQKAASGGTTQISTWQYLDDGTPGWATGGNPPERVWPAVPDGPCYGVAACADGASGVYVAGAAHKAGEGLNIAVLHYDAAGNLTQGFPYIYNYAPQNGDDVPVAMDLDFAQGALWVVGRSQGVGTGNDYVLIGLPTGAGALTTTLVIRYNHLSNGSDVPVAVKAAPVLSVGTNTLGVFVTGTSFDAATKDDIMTIEYQVDGLTGGWHSPWSRRYTGQGGATTERAVDLVIAATNEAIGVYVAGNRGTGSRNFLTLGYPRTPGPSTPDPWAQEYNNGGDDQAVKIAWGFKEGMTVPRIYVAGSSVGTGATYDMAVVAYDAPNGASSPGWGTPFRSGEDESDDRVSDMIVVEDNHLYIAGRWYNGADLDYRVYKLDLLNPSEAWTVPPDYDVGAGGSDFAAALTYRDNPEPPIPGGERSHCDIFVTGRNRTIFEVEFRYATVKFSQFVN